MNDRIIITAANRAYENSAKTLISSIHQHSFDDVDQIFVFDLGLDIEMRKQIQGYKKTTVVDFPDHIDCTPKQHLYKCYALYWGINKAKNVLWLDAGVMLLQPIKEMFDIINQDDIFMVKDTNHKNIAWTHKKCIDIMQATHSELHSHQLSSGILGFKSKGQYEHVIKEAYEYSKIEGCVAGNHANHRHDQSVYSILAARHGCPTQNIEKYGYYTDQKRDIHTAKKAGAVIFVHRNGHWDFSHLK